MASRLETFKALTATYKEEIAKLEETIHNHEAVIANLEERLAAETHALKLAKNDRYVTIEQMRGIDVVIRSMEDREREQRIADEIRATEARRKLEDKAYEV